MAFGTALAIYFIIWWLTLFMVLPWGARSQAEEGDIIQGTEPGAPHKNTIGRKLLINCVVAGVVFGIFWIVTVTLGFSVDDIPSIFPSDLGVK